MVILGNEKKSDKTPSLFYFVFVEGSLMDFRVIK